MDSPRSPERGPIEANAAVNRDLCSLSGGKAHANQDSPRSPERGPIEAGQDKNARVGQSLSPLSGAGPH